MKEHNLQALLEKVDADILSFKRRTSIFSLLSVCFIFAQISAATLSTMLVVSEYFETGYVFSAIAALLITVEGSLGIRERAASTFSTVHRLQAIKVRIENVGSTSSPLWEEYAETHILRKVNYVEGMFMICL